MTPEQIQNAEKLAEMLLDSGIKGKNTHIGIMCVIAKECHFVLMREKGYSGTSNERIRKLFPKPMKGISEERLSFLKLSDKAFFNHVYRNRLGNIHENDGNDFRGGGLNHLTGRGNYRKYCPPFCDIVTSPETLTYSITAAAWVVCEFFKVGLLKKALLLARYGRANKSLESAIFWAANINAGLGNGKKSAVVQRAAKNAKKQLKVISPIYTRVAHRKAVERAEV